jgi:frataxin-like iron-binding protein CyaY
VPLDPTITKAISDSLNTETRQVAQLRDYNEHQRFHDPSRIAWSATLPIELALGQSTPQELKEHYGYTDDEWYALRDNPAFLADLTAACDLVKQEGMSFKLKVRLMGEAMLETNWRMIHAPHSEVPAASKVKLMEATWRMGGFDVKDGVGAGSNMLNIQINLGG